MAETGKLQMFGKSFNTISDCQANLCLCTKGDVKIKTPGRFITIFKDGKLNIDDFTEIFAVNSVDNISKTGIYLVNSTDEEENSQAVYLLVDGQKILLASTDDSFLSYSTAQELTPEQVTLALSNIGIYFQTLDAAKASGIQDGLIYILEENELYKVNGGNFSKVVQEEQTEVSEHEHTYTQLQIGGIFIDGENNLISADSNLALQVNGHTYITIRSGGIYVNENITFDKNINIETQGAIRGESGFMIYVEDGETYLEVDNLIVHNSTDSETLGIAQSYIGSSVKNLITKAVWSSAPTDLELSLKYKNDFSVGDYIIIQVTEGNKADITFKRTTGDNDEEVQRIEVNLESAPSQDTVLLVTYVAIIDDEGTEEFRTAQVSVAAEIEEDEGMEPNTYGYVDISTEPEISRIDSVSTVSGDTNIYYAGEDSSGLIMPDSVIGTVISINPFIVNIPSLTSSADTILSNLKNSIINKVGYANIENYILYYNAENILLQKTFVENDSLQRNTLSTIGNLSGIQKPNSSTEYFSGHGIYSDNLIAISPTFYGGTFEEEQPVYGENLEMPTDFQAEKYNKYIPNVAWVKALIDAAVQEAIQNLQP